MTWMTAWVSSVLFKITLPGDQIALEGTTKQWIFLSFCSMNSDSEEGAMVAQWWEHLPPTNVALVQILASMAYVGWVFCWFSRLSWEVFLRVLRFSSLLKNQRFFSNGPIRVKRFLWRNNSRPKYHVTHSNGPIRNLDGNEADVTIGLDVTSRKKSSKTRVPIGWNLTHQCGLGSNPGINALCGLSLLLVLSLVLRGFSPGTPVFASLLKTNASKFQFDLERTDTFQRVLKNC